MSSPPEASSSRSNAFSQSTLKWLVPVMLFCSSMLMAMAWLGHLKFKSLPFLLALFACWLIVLPEYMLNISAVRAGHRIYTPSQMGAFNLSSGVVCVALVSRFVLGEHIGPPQLAGFATMIVAMILIGSKRPPQPDDAEDEDVDEDEETDAPVGARRDDG